MQQIKILKSKNSYYTIPLISAYKYYLRKKRAYAANDSFKRFMNSEDFGVDTLRALILRISDKITILKNQLNKDQTGSLNIEYDESIEEGLIDICLYTTIALVFYNVNSKILSDPFENCDIFMKNELRSTYDKYVINRNKFMIDKDYVKNLLESKDIGISPVKGCFIRLSDKFNLLKNFFSLQNILHNETLEDTLRDISSYSILSIYFLNHERQ